VSRSLPACVPPTLTSFRPSPSCSLRSCASEARAVPRLQVILVDPFDFVEGNSPLPAVTGGVHTPFAGYRWSHLFNLPDCSSSFFFPFPPRIWCCDSIVETSGCFPVLGLPAVWLLEVRLFFPLSLSWSSVPFSCSRFYLSCGFSCVPSFDLDFCFSRTGSFFSLCLRLIYFSFVTLLSFFFPP